VMVAGEITTQAKIDYEKVVRGVVQKIGFDTYVDDLSSVDSKGLSYKTCEVLVRINKQSPDIAGGVHVGKEEMDVGAGDQGIMFGYASDETEDCMPLTHSMATRLEKSSPMCARAVTCGGCALMARPRSPSSTCRKQMVQLSHRRSTLW